MKHVADEEIRGALQQLQIDDAADHQQQRIRKRLLDLVPWPDRHRAKQLISHAPALSNVS